MQQEHLIEKQYFCMQRMYILLVYLHLFPKKKLKNGLILYDIISLQLHTVKIPSGYRQKSRILIMV